jgi:hypothetical protein
VSRYDCWEPNSDSGRLSASTDHPEGRERLTLSLSIFVLCLSPCLLVTTNSRGGEDLKGEMCERKDLKEC